MPEQLTKHPDVTLQVLRSAGARCGDAGPAQILTACPAERFCKLPGGEICVYGLPDAANMTQLTQADWQGLARTVPSFAQPEGTAMPAAWLWLLLALLVGVAAGLALGRWRHRH